ncbi:MAG TPA: hypothetical protein VGB98_12260 [Pyrinomonadaceae bacterium]
MRELPQSLLEKIGKWAEAGTRPKLADRARHVNRKRAVVESFFSFCDKPPTQVNAADVLAWREQLETSGLAPKSVYDQISVLASFFASRGRRFNPAASARPPKPDTYQGPPKDETLPVEQLRSLLAEMRSKAGLSEGELRDKRDYAMLLLFMVTDTSREALTRLDISDVNFVGEVLHVRYYGLVEARYRKKEVAEREEIVVEPEIIEAVRIYLAATGRAGRTKGPLWVGHAQGQRDTEPLTAHALIINLKRHAANAGVERVELFKLRRTYRAQLKERVDAQTLIERKALIEDLTRPGKPGR